MSPTSYLAALPRNLHILILWVLQLFVNALHELLLELENLFRTKPPIATRMNSCYSKRTKSNPLELENWVAYGLKHPLYLLVLSFVEYK